MSLDFPELSITRRKGQQCHVDRGRRPLICHKTPFTLRKFSQRLVLSGSEQHEVLQVGSIQEGILQARHLIVQIENTH